jgi:hypothetical protein
MTLKVRELRLVAETDQGRYGAAASFADGLSILRADNTHGKSTLVQAIIYALGLEAMLGPRHEVPLPPAMTDALRTPAGETVAVRRSFVMLEIENGRGERWTMQRIAKDPEADHRLIRTWEGPAISRPAEAATQRDYYVRLSGAAQNEAGFHRRLAEFLGWSLPVIRVEDGKERQLYLEMIFPLAYVEQKRGWSGIQATMPTYGIPNAKRIALDFVLRLDVYGHQRRRQELRDEMSALRERYRIAVAEFRAFIADEPVMFQGLTEDAPSGWPEVEPRLLSSTGDEWRPFETVLTERNAELRELTDEIIPTADATAEAVESELSRLETELGTISRAGRSALNEAQLEAEQIRSLEQQLEALAEDRRRYQDAMTLRRLGAASIDIINGNECPTCHQDLPTTLTLASDAPVMSLEDNAHFIDEQIRTFEAMVTESRRLQDGHRRQVMAVRSRANEIRRAIRGSRDTLVAPGKSPSIAAVRRRVELEDRIAAMERIAERFDSFLDEAKILIQEIGLVRVRLADLPTSGLSASDEDKLQSLEGSVKEQLREYGFLSFDVDEIEISRESYVPTREGFDLGFVNSASDSIRMIWSYLLGLIEVARDHDTNHPGLLIFDEPRQQSADRKSFQAVLHRASRSEVFGQQVIFATSEPSASLHEMLSSVTYEETSWEGMVLEPIADDPKSRGGE